MATTFGETGRNVGLTKGKGASFPRNDGAIEFKSQSVVAACCNRYDSGEIEGDVTLAVVIGAPSD